MNPSNNNMIHTDPQLKGGLKIKGFSKTSLPEKPLITIITVVYNGKEYLEATIQSVINQTYDNVEYIIIDGGSTDGTLDLIRKYEDVIDYWVSEKDSGIYDAMNKGIDLATGIWINFMNSGDKFYNEKILQDIFLQKIYVSDIIYGHHEVRYPHKKKIVLAGRIKNLWKGSQFCHQSAFISFCFHKKNKFNITNRIGADFEFFYKAYCNHCNFQFLDLLISSVTSGGLSDVKRIESILGRWKVIDNSFSTNLYYILVLMNELSKKIIKMAIRH